jgi:DNA-binding NarL/FixJ family response regulator
MRWKQSRKSTRLARAFFGYDIAGDLADGTEQPLHVVIESSVFVAALAALTLEIRRVVEEQERAARLSGELQAIMRRQFAEWGLSPAECEVALLLIKGLSMREISAARKVAEKTVRQQATAVYAKSGYAGRHELAAHFIEDLLGEGVTASTP